MDGESGQAEALCHRDGTPVPRLSLRCHKKRIVNRQRVQRPVTIDNRSDHKDCWVQECFDQNLVLVPTRIDVSMLLTARLIEMMIVKMMF